MSEQLTTHLKEPEAQASTDLDALLTTVLAYQPNSAADALSTVEFIEVANSHIVRNGRKYELDGRPLDATIARQTREISKAGINTWKLTPEQAVQTQNVAEGGRPEGVTVKAWYEMGREQRTPYREAAERKLGLSEDIKAFQAAQRDEAQRARRDVQATVQQGKIETEVEYATDTAYRTKRAELPLASDEYKAARQAYVDGKLEKSAMTGAAREMLKENLGLQFDEYTQTEALKAGKAAADSRLAELEAKGGSKTIDRTLKTEKAAAHDEALILNEQIAAEKAAAEKEKFLRRLHGSDYNEHMRRQEEKLAKTSLTSGALGAAAVAAETTATTAQEPDNSHDKTNVYPVPAGFNEERWTGLTEDDQKILWNAITKHLEQDDITQAEQIWEGLKPLERAAVMVLIRNEQRSKPQSETIVAGAKGTTQAAAAKLSAPGDAKEEAINAWLLRRQEGAQQAQADKTQPRVLDLSPRGLRRRITSKFHEAAALLMAQGGRVMAYAQNPEQFTRRKKASAIALGGLAVAAGVGLTLAMQRSGNHAGIQAFGLPSGGSGGANSHNANNMVDSALATSPHPSAVRPETQEYTTTTLKKGGNLWKVAKEYLSQGGHKPTTAEINAYDIQLAKANGIDVATGQDRRMTAGRLIKLVTFKK